MTIVIKNAISQKVFSYSEKDVPAINTLLLEKLPFDLFTKIKKINK